MRILAVMLAAALAVSTAPAPVSAESSGTTPNIAVYDNLLSSRYFVVDTFTGDSFPENNPHAYVQGYCNEDYLYKDILDSYELDPKFAAGVDVYYRLEHKGESVSEVLSGVQDTLTLQLPNLFENVSDVTNFIQGAQNKNYDATLNSIFSSDYTSESGLSMSGDLGGLQDLRTAADYASSIKDMLGTGSDINGYFGTLDTVYKQTMVNRTLPHYGQMIDSYIGDIDDILDKAADNTGKKKEAFDDLFEAKYYSLAKSDIEADNEWIASVNRDYALKTSGKVLKYLELGDDLIKGTLENALMLESLLNQREQMRGSLERTRNKAIEKNDGGFARVSKVYIDLMKDDELSEADKQSLIAALMTFQDQVQNKFDSYGWDLAENAVKNQLVSTLACDEAAKQATAIFVADQMADVSEVVSILTTFVDKLTGFGTVCDSAYELEYLQKIRGYATEVYQEDENAYRKARSGGASTKELDILAKNALDDLYLLKRLALRANEIAYNASTAQANSWQGEFISWIDGCDDKAALTKRYNKMQGIIVDTAIDPVPHTPIKVSSGQTLKLVKTENSYYLGLNTAGGDTFVFGEPEYRLLGGIEMQGGTIEFDNRTTQDIFVSSIYASADSSSVTGTIKMIGTGDVTVSQLGTTSRSNNWASLQIQSESEECGALHATTLENTGSITVTQVPLTVEKNVIVPEYKYLKIQEGAKLDIGGSLKVYDGAIVTISDSNVSVKGDFYAEGYARNPSGTMREIYLTVGSVLKVDGDIRFKNTAKSYDNDSNYIRIARLYGTIELKGDLIDESEVYYGWMGTPTLRLTGDKVQTLDYRSAYIEGNDHGQIGTMEVYCPAVKVNNEFSVKTLATNVKIQSGVQSLKTSNPIEGKIIEISGDANAGSLQMGAGSRMQCGGSLTVKGSLAMTDGAIAEIAGDMKVLSGTIVKIENATIDIGNDFYAEGYARNPRGTMQESSFSSGSTLKVGGDIRFKNTATSYNNDSNYTRIATMYGTIELKGDLIDESEVYYGWRGNPTLKLTGDKVQTLDYRTRYIEGYDHGQIGTMEVYCPAVKVNNEFSTKTLATNVKIQSDVSSLKISDLIEGKTVEISGDANVSSLKMGAGSRMQCGGSLTVKGSLAMTDGAVADIARDMEALSGAAAKVGNATIDIGNDFYLEGYARNTGGTIYDMVFNAGSTFKIGGDMRFRNTAVQANIDSNHTRIASMYGTIELKGDLIDESEVFYGWMGAPTLKLTGDKVQTLDYRCSNNYGQIGTIEALCPAINVNKAFSVSTLASDIDISNTPKSISIRDWASKTLRLHNISKLVNINVPSGYSMFISLADGGEGDYNGEEDAYRYDVVCAPTTESTYAVNYKINGNTSATYSYYAPGSLILPYEALKTGSSDYEWYKDRNFTERWDLNKDTVTSNTDIFLKDPALVLSELRDELSQLLESAQDVDQEAYTEESYAVFAQAVLNAEAVLNDENAGKQDLRAAVKAVQDAVSALEEPAVIPEDPVEIPEDPEPEVIKIAPKVVLSQTKYTYNGRIQKPVVTVYNKSEKLIKDQDYVVTIPAAKAVGKYTVKVTMKGAYSGSGSSSFTIIPKGTSISKVTAAKKSIYS